MHKAPCHVLSLDIVDITGVHVMDVQGRLHKHRLDRDGQYIGHHDTVRYLTYIFLDGRWSRILASYFRCYRNFQ